MLSYQITGTLTAGIEPGKPSGQGSVQGSFSWGTSYTYSTADTNINNLSKTGFYGNDAAWQFIPREPELGGQKGGCENFGLRNLADLAWNEFSPGTSFILRITEDYVGLPLLLVSDWTIRLQRSRIPLRNCAFGCSCGIDRTQYPGSPFKVRFSTRVLIPDRPQ